MCTSIRSTEGLARRIAADAERAYAELSKEIHPPRGMIDIVVSDDVDVSNGSATPTPTNRIVIYANPPVSESALRYTNDWAQLVVTHELTHIFHLDRSRGIWALGQKIFGRAPLLFPNSYSPSWLTEGLAVYEESKLTGAGRIEGSEHRMIARAAAIDAPLSGDWLSQSRAGTFSVRRIGVLATARCSSTTSPSRAARRTSASSSTSRRRI